MHSDNFENTSGYTSLFRRKKSTIFAIVLLFVMSATVLTIVQPFKYSAESKLLVIQSFPANQDPYTASKSNEYLSSVLASVVSTNSFYNEVMNAGFNINANYFPKEIKKQMKSWRDTVKAGSQYDTGMLNITVYHKDAYQADQIIRAVNSVLQSKHTLYHGIGEGVTIKILDQPIVSNRPVKPNVPLNILAGFAVGLVLALVYVYLFPEDEYNLSLMGVRKNQQINAPSRVGVLPGAQPVTHDTYVQDNSGGYVEEVLTPSQVAHYQALHNAQFQTQNNYAMSNEEVSNDITGAVIDDELGYEDIIQGSMSNVARRS
jgi:capsular polysaccharide biosynthesis protein